jgi:hypothetical protein
MTPSFTEGRSNWQGLKSLSLHLITHTTLYSNLVHVLATLFTFAHPQSIIV